MLGARVAVVRGNTFRRMHFGAVNVAYDATEGVNQLRDVTIADNIATDSIGYPGVGNVYNVTPTAATFITGVTSFVVGANQYPSLYFGKPWDYDTSVIASGTSFAPQARGVTIHDNQTMRTLPAVANYSAWGYGQEFTAQGFVDRPADDSVLRPGTGINAGVNVTSLNIHNNNVQNTFNGINIQDNTASPMTITFNVSFNFLYDTYNAGIQTSGTGSTNIESATIVGNHIDVDPYNLSPGRAASHGSWTNSYSASKCLSYTYTSSVLVSGNVFSNCYTPGINNTGNGWIVRDNILRGQPSSATGQPTTWSSIYYGIGVYPANVGGQTYLANSASDPTATPPGSFGALNNSHVTTAAVVPSSGFHVVGDVVYSTSPATCGCIGWLALTTGTAWVLGTDYNPVQPAASLGAVQTPTTGFALTVPNNTSTYLLKPAGTLATGTITMPAAPFNNQPVTISSTQTVTTLTLSPNTSQSINNAPTTLAPGVGVSYIYNAGDTTWYRVQ
jgi:hypothetical protein